jgi:hypothetical protein
MFPRLANRSPDEYLAIATDAEFEREPSISVNHQSGKS